MSDAASCDYVRYEKRDDHIAIVTLDRPDKRNAINGAMARAIEAVVKDSEADPDVWLVIFTATGPVFSAGADLAEAAAGRGHDLTTADGGFAGFVDSVRVKPWIAAIQGAAVGGGLEMALACDMRLCGPESIFGLPEVQRGLIAGGRGVYRLGRHIPRGIALEMLATGDPIPAEKAAHWGLVNQVAADGDVLAAAIALGRRICANAPLSVRESLALGRIAIEHSDRELGRMTDEAGRRLEGTADYEEGPKAFMEKRAPVWKGC